MGAGARVVSTSLMSVQAATKATGREVASYFTGPTREVWLVWVKGPFRILNCIQNGKCPTRQNQLYFIAIDAKTGVNYDIGWARSYPGAPKM